MVQNAENRKNRDLTGNGGFYSRVFKSGKNAPRGGTLLNDQNWYIFKDH